MASQEIKKCYDFIVPAIKEAGEVVKEGFYGSKIVEQKGNVSYDLVTDIDKKAEDLLIARIKQRNPNHIIIGEETCGKNCEKCGNASQMTDLPTWIIDPIDGTINFIHGIPQIGISVALAIKKEVILGVVYNPITDQLFSAIKGEGAFLNGTRIYSSRNEDLHKGIIGNELSLASIPFLRDRTLERIKCLTKYGVLGSFGSAALCLCFVANGSLDVYYTDGLRCWDVAAGVLILQEAGGCASSPDGKPFNMFSRVLLTAGNEVLLKEMVSILTNCDSKTMQSLKETMPHNLKKQLNIED